VGTRRCCAHAFLALPVTFTCTAWPVLPACTARLYFIISTIAASIVLGKLSGRKAVSTRLEQLGFGLSAEEVNDVFKRFKVSSDIT
jgi:hypothetical protein